MTEPYRNLATNWNNFSQNLTNKTSMAPGLLAGAVSGVGSLLGSIFGQRAKRRQDKRNFERQRAHNMEMAQYQWDKQVEFFDLQNAYNDPKAEMRRLMEAGLNPHLLYGNGAQANRGADMGTPQAPDVAKYQVRPGFNPLESLGTYINLRRANSEDNLTQANVQLNKQKQTTEQINQALNQANTMLINAKKNTEGLSQKQIQQNIRKSQAEVTKLQDLLPYQTEALRAQAQANQASSQKALDSILTQKKQRNLMDQDLEIKKLVRDEKGIGLRSKAAQATVDETFADIIKDTGLDPTRITIWNYLFNRMNNAPKNMRELMGLDKNN